MGALPHGGAVHLLDHYGLLFSRDAPEGHGALTRLVGVEVHALVHVAVGVTGDGDGLFPVLYHGLDGVDQDGGAEHGAVQNGTDGAVGALPHLRQLGILLHALLVGGDGGALDRHTVFPGGIGGVHCHLVLGLIAVQQPQVIILGLEIHEGEDQSVLDPAPEDAGHLVAVHLHDGRSHFDFFHVIQPSLRNNSSNSRPG